MPVLEKLLELTIVTAYGFKVAFLSLRYDNAIYRTLHLFLLVAYL
jgi:hypothetical protein